MEHLNNLPPFYVGQKVVYITGRNLPKDSIHVINSLLKQSCGCWAVDIGLENDFFATYLNCTDCGNVRDKINDNIRWFNSKSFRPLKEQTFPLISMKKVLEDQLVCSN